TCRPAPGWTRSNAKSPRTESALVSACKHAARHHVARDRRQQGPMVGDAVGDRSVECEHQESIVMRAVAGDRAGAEIRVTESLYQPHTGGAGLEFTFTEAAEIRRDHRYRTAVGECGARDVNPDGTGVFGACQWAAGFARPEPAEQLSEQRHALAA